MHSLKYKLFLSFALIIICIQFAAAQGYIYVHNKSINEESAVDLTYTLKDNTGTTINTFNLNDLASNFLNAYDIGAGQGTGAGELWAIAGPNSNGALTSSGTVYRRANASSQWVATSVANFTNSGHNHAIDGAYLNQFVYLTGGKVNFYNAGTITTIYTGTDATDVGTANGNIAITTTGLLVKTWAGNYTATTVSSSTTWNTIVNGTTETASRLDMSGDGSTVVYINATGGATVKTIPFIGGAATDLLFANAAARPGSTITPSNLDVAYDDNGSIYCTGKNTVASGTSDVVYSYAGGVWTTEPEARNVHALTGGAAGQAWGISVQATGDAQSLFTRATDNLGNHYWIDDERIKNPATPQFANSIMIQVPAGIYTLAESFPSGWDLGRFNIYDPTGNSTGNTLTNTATLNISSGESVNVEFISEKLNPTAIPLTCNPQVLQSFDQGATFGSGTFGNTLQNTAYHYASAISPPDGYYFLVNSISGKFFGTGSTITDHTGNGGYFLMVNASYGKDEFYRQRVTNLIPGLQYVISFYAANITPGGIFPNISFGLQDLSGNSFGIATTGNIPANIWTKYSITFTMPAGDTTADLYLKNNNIGGSGNDVGIDDITLNLISPPPASLAGPSTLCFGSSYTFTDATSGGVFQSSNTAVATINASSGLLATIANGSTVISYTTSNAVGCTSSATLATTINPAPTVSSTATPATVCIGQQVSLNSTPGAGTSPYTYLWSGSPIASAGITSSATQNATAIPTAGGAELYTITLTDAKGCTAAATQTVTVSGNAAPTVATTTNFTSVCNGETSLTLTSTPSGGLSPYSYLWSGSGIGVTTTKNTTALPVLTGVYNVLVTDSRGCIGLGATSTVTVNADPTISITTSSPNLCGTQNLLLGSVPAGGSGSYATYAWTSSIGGVINGGTTIQNTTARPLTSGSYSYSVVVKDSKGCTGTASTTVPITVQTSGAFSVSAAYSPTTTPVCSGTVVTLSSLVSGGGTAPFTYAWAGSGIAASGLQNTTATPTASGLFTITVTDANNCYTTGSTANLAVNPSPAITASSSSLPVICTSSAGTTIVTLSSTGSGGTGALTYAWTQITNTGSGTGGLITFSGQNTTAKPTAYGTYSYTITATDTKACTGSATVSEAVVNFTSPVISGIVPTTASAVCGTVINFNATASSGLAPYLYTWTGVGVTTPANSSTAVGLANPASGTTNTYSLIVSDANSCQASATTIVTLNPAIIVSAFPSNVSTCAGTSITMNAVATGGSGTYSTYAWTQSSAFAGLGVTNTQATTATPTAAGSYVYTVGVTDNRGCTASGTAGTTSVAAAFTSTSSLNTNNLCSAGPQTVNLSSALTGGGTAPYTYIWSSANGATFTTPALSSTNATLTNLTDAFSVFIQDSKGCISTAYAGAVTVNPSPTITAAMNKTIACASPPTTVNLTSSPGAGSGVTNSYLWTASAGVGSGLITSGAGQNNNSQNTSVIPASGGTGTYTVLISDADGCNASATTPTSLTVDVLTPVIQLICGATTVSLSETSGTPNVSWLWSTTSGGSFTPSNTVMNPFIKNPGSYSVLITDPNNCTGSVTHMVIYSDCGALPVTLADFEATKIGDETLLSWITEVEINNNFFSVERSTDAGNWMQIGQVMGHGNTSITQNYHFTDQYPFSGFNYYRLKQVDFDQNFSYSPVRSVQFGDAWKVAVFPNPANTNDLVNIRSNVSIADVQIMSITGVKVITRQITSSDIQSTGIITINMSSCSSGVYFVRLTNSKGQVKSIELVKE